MSHDYAGMLERLGSASLDPALLERLNQLGQNSRDQLTGLYDCRSFTYQLQNALKSHSSYALVASNIDHMQELNLISGWVVGDIAVCTYASFLEKLPVEGAFSGRTSGCTFMTFLPTRSPDPIRSWLKEAFVFIKGLELPGVELFPEGHLTLSAGVFLSPKGGTTADHCMIEAKKRLAHSLSQGGGQVSLIAGDEIELEDEDRSMAISVSKDENDWESGKLKQLSLNGLAFHCSKPFLVRETLALNLPLTSGKELKLSGEVVWRKASDHDGYSYSIGLRFARLAEEEREALENFMTGGM